MRFSLKLSFAGVLCALPLAFSAQAFVSRGEFVQLALFSRGERPAGGNCFTDVTTQVFAAAVCSAQAQGIIGGYPDGSFRPSQAITFVEAAKIGLLAHNVRVNSDSIWYRPYVEKLGEWNAIPGTIFNILSPITPSQASDLLSRIRNRGSGTDDDDTDNDDRDSNKDIDITVTDSDNTVEPGDTVTYTIRLENNDNDDREVDIRATLDDAMTFVSATSGYDRNGDNVEWDNVDIDEDDTETVRITVRIDNDADDGDTVRLRVRAGDDDETETTAIEDEDNDDDDDDNDEDINITISDSPDPAEPGERVTYTIQVENNDNRDRTVDVTAFLDSDMDFVSATNSGDDDDDAVTWDNVRIDEDETETLRLTVRIDNAADDGDTVRLRVEADDDEDAETTRIDDDNDNDDDDDDNDDVNVTLTIEDADDPVEPGDTVTYRIRIENNENSSEEVDVRASLDPDMHYISATEDPDRGGDEVEWDDILVRRDETKTILLTVEMDDDLEDGDTVELDVEAGDDQDTETTSIQEEEDDNDEVGDEDIFLTLTAEDDPVEPGDLLTYRITLENDANSRAFVDVRAELDSLVSFVSATLSGRSVGHAVEWDDVSVERRSSRTFLLVVRVLTTADDGDRLELRVEAAGEVEAEAVDVED